MSENTQSSGTLDRLAVHQAALDRLGTSNDVAAGDYGFTYDGNGNVVQVVDLQNGVSIGFAWHGSRLAARYEYDAYGNVIGPDTNADGQFDEFDAPGHYAGENPLRFSTKYFDRETGLGYWGYRYYSPALGRWVSRDPLEERGGAMLYAYSGNRPLWAFDALGRCVVYGDGTSTCTLEQAPQSMRDPSSGCEEPPPTQPTTSPAPIPRCRGNECAEHCSKRPGSALALCEVQDGKCEPCVCECPVTTSAPASQPGGKATGIIGKCRMKEEEHHARNDLRCPTSGACKTITKPGFTECGGDIANLSCLRDALRNNECGSDEQCRQAVKAAAEGEAAACSLYGVVGRDGKPVLKPRPGETLPESYGRPCPSKDVKDCVTLYEEIMKL